MSSIFSNPSYTLDFAGGRSCEDTIISYAPHLIVLSTAVAAIAVGLIAAIASSAVIFGSILIASGVVMLASLAIITIVTNRCISHVKNAF